MSFRQSSTGAGRFDVVLDGRIIGVVGRFTMGAAQFGSTWMGRTPDGRTSTRFPSRDAAAAWLVEEAGRSEAGRPGN